MSSKPVYVVDASVAAKWILNEPDRSAALEYLVEYREGGCDLAAPRLLVSEIEDEPAGKR